MGIRELLEMRSRGAVVATENVDTIILLHDYICAGKTITPDRQRDLENIVNLLMDSLIEIDPSKQ